jgi:hypothetical protein
LGKPSLSPQRSNYQDVPAAFSCHYRAIENLAHVIMAVEGPAAIAVLSTALPMVTEAMGVSCAPSISRKVHPLLMLEHCTRRCSGYVQLEDPLLNENCYLFLGTTAGLLKVRQIEKLLFCFTSGDD